MLRISLRHFVLLTLIGPLTACGGGDAPRFPTPQVTVAQPERRDVTPFVDFTGTTRAIASAEVRAQVAGRLESMAFTRSTATRRKFDLRAASSKNSTSSFNRGRACGAPMSAT